MLREEELNASPTDTENFNSSNDISANRQKNKQNKDFSFIQNRVPSPLNNNFLLSAAQSPQNHVRQISETFMIAAHNLMNQEDFKIGGATLLMEKDSIQEENYENHQQQDASNESKISLFTNEGEEEHNDENQNQNLNYQESEIKNQQAVSESNYESNQFNYSESNFPHNYNGTSSIGGILHGPGSMVGSFVGMLNYRSSSNCLVQGAGGNHGGNPSNSQANGSRESVTTPFIYDEASLMNLSNTPSMIRCSNLTRQTIGGNPNNQERIISSTKLNYKHQQQISAIQERLEEHDESVLRQSNQNVRLSQDYHKNLLVSKELQQMNIKPQQTLFDQPRNSIKPNPLELPLQRTQINTKFQQQENQQILKLGNQQSTGPQLNISNSFSPWLMGVQGIDEYTKQNQAIDQLLSGKQNLEQQLLQQKADAKIQENNSQDSSNCNEDEIMMIKKKLDFSRLSSQANLDISNIQMMLQFQNNGLQKNKASNSNCSKEKYQNASLLQSLMSDAQNQSLTIAQETERISVPFEDAYVMENIRRGTLNNNTNKIKFQNSDDGIQIYPQFQIDQSFKSEQNSQETIISPSSRNHTNKTRPPLLKSQTSNQNLPNQQQRFSFINNSNPQQQVEIIQQNCINIFQGSYNQSQIPNDNNQIAALTQNLQVPPQSRTNSTNSYSTSIIDNINKNNNINTSIITQKSVPAATNANARINNVTTRQFQQFNQQIMNNNNSNPQQRVTHFQQPPNVIPDTPRDPSSVMYDNEDYTSTVTQRSAIPAVSDLFFYAKLKAFAEEQKLNQQNTEQSNQYSQQSEQEEYHQSESNYNQNIFYEFTDDNSANIQQDTSREKVKPKKLKLKKKSIVGIIKDSEKIKIIQKKSVSKQYGSIERQGSIERAITQNQMSKTVIIQKQRAPSQSKRSKAQNSIEYIIQQNQQQVASKASKKSIKNPTQTEIKNAQVTQLQSSSNNQQVQSVRSIPVSISSSQQNSFMQQQQIVLKAAKKILKNKNETQKNLNIDITNEDEEQKKKLKKKIKTIQQKQMNGPNEYLQINQKKNTTLASARDSSKCNTQRSMSKAKQVCNTNQHAQTTMGTKKSSQVSLHNNKENIKPPTSQMASTFNLADKVQKKFVQHIQGLRPEDILSSFENINMLNAQEFLNQQRLSHKQLTGLFNTMDASDNFKNATIGFESDNSKNQVHEYFETDPYYNLGTQIMDTQRASVREVIRKPSKKGNKTVVTLNKMQSPYNSKTIKNKFSNKLNKESKNKSQTKYCDSKKQSSCKNSSDEHGKDELDSCRRCDELLNLLKTTRFLAR